MKKTLSPKRGKKPLSPKLPTHSCGLCFRDTRQLDAWEQRILADLADPWQERSFAIMALGGLGCGSILVCRLRGFWSEGTAVVWGTFESCLICGFGVRGLQGSGHLWGDVGWSGCFSVVCFLAARVEVPCRQWFYTDAGHSRRFFLVLGTASRTQRMSLLHQNSG